MTKYDDDETEQAGSNTMKNFHMLSGCAIKENESERKKGSLVAEAHHKGANLMGCPGRCVFLFWAAFRTKRARAPLSGALQPIRATSQSTDAGSGQSGSGDWPEPG